METLVWLGVPDDFDAALSVMCLAKNSKSDERCSMTLAVKGPETVNSVAV